MPCLSIKHETKNNKTKSLKQNIHGSFLFEAFFYFGKYVVICFDIKLERRFKILKVYFPIINKAFLGSHYMNNKKYHLIACDIPTIVWHVMPQISISTCHFIPVYHIIKPRKHVHRYIWLNIDFNTWIRLTLGLYYINSRTNQFKSS